jgi:hypothetical protein
VELLHWWPLELFAQSLSVTHWVHLPKVAVPGLVLQMGVAPLHMVLSVHCTHWLPELQKLGAGQVPQLSVLPHPSATTPHTAPCWEQVFGWQQVLVDVHTWPGTVHWDVVLHWTQWWVLVLQ